MYADTTNLSFALQRTHHGHLSGPLVMGLLISLAEAEFWAFGQTDSGGRSSPGIFFRGIPERHIQAHNRIAVAMGVLALDAVRMLGLEVRVGNARPSHGRGT